LECGRAAARAGKMRGNCREQETEMGIAAIDDVGTRRVSKRFIVFTTQGYINDNARNTRDSEAA
jgi:hypothetical protein